MAAIPASINIMPSGGPLRAVSYARVSTGRQRDHDLSIPVQEEGITRYAAESGMTLIGTFRDEAKTGRNAKRKGLQALLDFVLSPERPVDVVLIYTYSRLPRGGAGSRWRPVLNHADAANGTWTGSPSFR